MNFDYVELLPYGMSDKAITKSRALKDREVRDIRFSDASNKELAIKYMRSESVISNVRTGLTYNDVRWK